MILPHKKISISFVGDVLPSNMTYTEGFGNYDEINRIQIKDADNKPDIFFANLESPLLLKSSGDKAFSGNPRIIKLFKSVGINIVSIANNHILEHGEAGFYETIKLLRENDIKVIGINEDNSSNIETFKLGNQILAFAAFNAIHDIKNPSLYANSNESGVELAVEKMRKLNATFKVISFHWGNEYISLPNPYQIKMARYAIEKGFDMIIGHHPHVVQKIEKLNQHYIFYSLGNAYFDYLFTSKVKRGLRVDCILTEEDLNVEYGFISTRHFGFNKIDGNTESLLLSEFEIEKQNSVFYENWYAKKIKKIRFNNRLKMKVFLFEMLFSLPILYKYKLIKNIGHFISKKLK